MLPERADVRAGSCLCPSEPVGCPSCAPVAWVSEQMYLVTGLWIFPSSFCHQLFSLTFPCFSVPIIAIGHNSQFGPETGRKHRASFLGFQGHCVLYLPFFSMSATWGAYVGVQPPAVPVPVRLRVAEPASSMSDTLHEQERTQIDRSS